MKRYYFIDDSLDELEAIEQELENAGVNKPQIHVLSQDDAGVSRHQRLNEVAPFLKKDIIHSGERGALIGLAVSALAIVVAYFTRLPDTIGWVPFVFLSIILLGFFTWEGGLWGIQVPNSRFRRFERALKEGNHIIIIDVDTQQEPALQRAISAHPGLQPAGVGVPAPRWIVGFNQKWRQFLNWAP